MKRNLGDLVLHIEWYAPIVDIRDRLIIMVSHGKRDQNVFWLILSLKPASA